MNYANLFKIALKAIAANKMRSFLTALGIIIGVASVITMLAIGQGSKKSIQANIAEMGSNMIMIHPGADMRGGVRQDASSMETLKISDYTTLKDECNYIKGISPTVTSSGQWIYGNNNTPSTIYGVSQDYLDIRQLSVSDGEIFTDADIKSSAKVCILGQTVVDNLFPDGSDPIGKVVRFNSIPFRVIGVLKKKGYNSMGMDQDDLALAPYTTVMKRILAQTYLGGITCSAITENVTDKATEEITQILRRNHKLKNATSDTPGDEDDFNIRSQEELSNMMNSTTDMLTVSASGMCRRHIPDCWRHRHYEHNVRQCYRTHTRDRTAHECRSTRHRHPEPVSHRSDNAQCNRWNNRSPDRRRSVLCGKHICPLAHFHPTLEHHHELCGLHIYRSFLRMVSCEESGAA